MHSLILPNTKSFLTQKYISTSECYVLLIYFFLFFLLNMCLILPTNFKIDQTIKPFEQLFWENLKFFIMPGNSDTVDIAEIFLTFLNISYMFLFLTIPATRFLATFFSRRFFVDDFLKSTPKNLNGTSLRHMDKKLGKVVS